MRKYIEVEAEEGCNHRDYPRQRLAVSEESPDHWLLKCGCIVLAHLNRGDCPECLGTGDGPRGCCGDFCLTCKGTGEKQPG